MLHITNGDCAGDLLKATGLIDNPDEDLVIWRDVLGEGPTPEGLTLDEMTELRSQFIASRSWATYEEALSSFSHRNQQIARFRDYSEVVWWFEHDLLAKVQPNSGGPGAAPGIKTTETGCYSPRSSASRPRLVSG